MLCQGSTTAVQAHLAQLTNTNESGILFRLCYLQVCSSKIKNQWIQTVLQKDASIPKVRFIFFPDVKSNLYQVKIKFLSLKQIL